jgi:hypothetical protein
MRQALPALALLLLPVATTGTKPASAPTLAAPRIIVFHSGVLQGRRYMTDWSENLRFMLATNAPVSETREALGERPYIEVALYWHGPTWEAYAADTALLNTLPLPVSSSSWSPSPPPLPPEDRRRLIQPARLYLGWHDHPPLFDYFSAGANPGLRSISSAGLEILRAHDVPTRGAEDGI